MEQEKVTDIANFENQKIAFWLENHIDKKHYKNLGIIISDFMNSTEHQMYKDGMLFERCILNFMATFPLYGSFEKFENNELTKLWEIYQFRIDK